MAVLMTWRRRLAGLAAAAVLAGVGQGAAAVSALAAGPLATVAIDQAHPAGLDIAALDEARKGRKIVGRSRHSGVRRILMRHAERPVGILLEP